MTFFIGQLEQGEQNGGRHYQLYMEFDQNVSWSQIIAMMPAETQRRWREHANGRPAFGTAQQNIAYVRKEQTFVNRLDFYPTFPTRIAIGQPAPEGAVRQNQAAAQMALSGLHTLAEVCQRYPDVAVRSGHNLARLVAMSQKLPEWRELKVRWYWGPTATGKSRRANWEARKMYGIDGVYDKTKGEWFDGYNAQRAMTWHDYYGKNQEIDQVLNILDGHPLRVPIKGGFVGLLITDVWITSNVPPQDLFPYERPEKREAFLRRIHVIERMDMPCWTPPLDDSLPASSRASVAPTPPTAPASAMYMQSGSESMSRLSAPVKIEVVID